MSLPNRGPGETRVCVVCRHPGERAIFRHRTRLPEAEYGLFGSGPAGRLGPARRKPGSTPITGIQIEQAKIGHMVVDNCHIPVANPGDLRKHTDQGIQRREKIGRGQRLPFHELARAVPLRGGGVASMPGWETGDRLCDPDAHGGPGQGQLPTNTARSGFQCATRFKAFIDGCDIFNQVAGSGMSIPDAAALHSAGTRWRRPAACWTCNQAAWKAGRSRIAVTGVNGAIRSRTSRTS